MTYYVFRGDRLHDLAVECGNNEKLFTRRKLNFHTAAEYIVGGEISSGGFDEIKSRYWRPRRGISQRQFAEKLDWYFHFATALGRSIVPVGEHDVMLFAPEVSDDIPSYDQDARVYRCGL